MGTFQYFLLYTCPHPGRIAERIAAFLGLCSILMSESTFSEGIESFAFNVSICCAEEINEVNKNEEKNIKTNESRTARTEFFCMRFLNSPLKNRDLIHRNIHLPENMVKFIQ